MAFICYEDSQRNDIMDSVDAEYIEKHFEELKDCLIEKRGNVIFKGLALDDLRNVAYDLLKVSFYELKFSEKQLIEVLNLTYLREIRGDYKRQHIIVASEDLPHLPPMELWRIHSYSNMNSVMNYCFPKLLRKERIEIPYGTPEIDCYRVEHFELGDDPVVPSNIKSYQYHIYEAGYGEITFVFIRRYVNGRYIDDFLDVNYLKRYERTCYAHYAKKLKELCETDMNYGFSLMVQKYDVVFLSEDDIYDSNTSRYLDNSIGKGTTVYDRYGKHTYEGFKNDRVVMDDLEYWGNKEIKNSSS